CPILRRSLPMWDDHWLEPWFSNGPTLAQTMGPTLAGTMAEQRPNIGTNDWANVGWGSASNIVQY
ncbi:MAG: hypothetical protein O7D30_11110, partial [Rickettsia endosymbiont of Ixodes persulcatus]|nr:hypothetical protein [Rickettsia endosymbiont of Ixodes persulcatus]